MVVVYYSHGRYFGKEENMPKITIKAVRTNADMTIDEWANALGVSKTTVCNWENGITEPNLSMLQKMSELSGVPIDFMVIPEKKKGE